MLSDKLRKQIKTIVITKAFDIIIYYVFKNKYLLLKIFCLNL